MSIKRALRSLEDADLIERSRGRITVPNSLFVKFRQPTKTFLCMERFCPMRMEQK